MSKKRNNNASETTAVLNETEDTNVETVEEKQNEVVETVTESPVVETTDEPVGEPVDGYPVVEETVTDKDVEEVVGESSNTIEIVASDDKKDEEEVTETPSDTEEVVVEGDEKPTENTDTESVNVNDPTIVTETTEPGKVENDENLNPVTENVSGKQEISGEKDKIQIELCKKYKCKFAQSYFMKICATSREFSLFSMIETYLMNKTAYIGLTSLEDFNHIKDVMENNNISFKYKILDPHVKKEFLQKLEFNTQYAVTHK